MMRKVILSNLVETFVNNNLIDEYRLIVNPIILGGIKPLFNNTNGIFNLELKDSIKFKCGNVLLVYNNKQ